MMTLYAFICIIGALFGGWMLNEIRHERRRLRRHRDIADQARRTRAVITWLGR